MATYKANASPNLRWHADSMGLQENIHLGLFSQRAASLFLPPQEHPDDEKNTV
jgi:hypothetical protein